MTVAVPRVTLVGALPPPSGGISWFVHDLCRCYPDLVEEVLRTGATTAVSPPLLTEVKDLPGVSGPAKFLGLWMAMLSRPERHVHFNFSGPRGLTSLAVLPKRSQRWMLTLHHGDLAARWHRMGRQSKWLARVGLGRADWVGYISAGQRAFYEGLGVPPSRLVRLWPYVREAPIEVHLPTYLRPLRQSYRTLILASGYAQSSYRHEWILEYLQHRTPRGTALVFCVYAQGDEEILRELVQVANDRSDVLVLYDLNRSEFLSVMRYCDVYARPTAIDSFGVAVAQAVDMGLRVVASDVCERFPGASCFPANDQNAFFSSLDQAIAQSLHDFSHPRQYCEWDARQFYAWFLNWESAGLSEWGSPSAGCHGGAIDTDGDRCGV